MTKLLMLTAISLIPLLAADPTVPVYWSASQLKDIDKKAASRLNSERHLGTDRLLDSAFVLYRDGPSQAEIHTNLADFIVVREGEGAVLVGGKIVDGKPSGAGEVRGTSIEGGTKYRLAAGDQLYVPANTVHQFLVEPGKHFTATIIKITPKR
jgi:mannose-6-phosphate isomerase-like protein (cupin superfamily)